ncbi:MAG: VIT1/CCC1 transporter family protein [Candidatus Micrarchaeota archaeon]|nr:VIT1/CCC1 transporter family protein [Candidatus Micrarchaeota archaeon]
MKAKTKSSSPRPTAKPVPPRSDDDHDGHIREAMRKHLAHAPDDIQKRHAQLEHTEASSTAGLFRQIVLGGQDGLVNVLGIVLGVASGTGDTRIVIIAGIAAAVAESLSMGAVAYTSARAAQDHYRAQYENEKREIKEVPEVERKEIELIYFKKGFRGPALETIVTQICSNEQLWLQTMMREELGLYESEFINPVNEGVVVGVSSVVGSLLPLIPFLLMPVGEAVLASIAFSLLVLAAAGAVKARLTTGVWWKSALEMMVIGGLAGIAGYAVGLATKAVLS